MISIITVNYNGIKDTRNFLYSLKESVKDVQYEVIVVDNASKNDEASILSSEFDWIKCFRSEKNLGFSGGNNLGVELAVGDYFLFLNNDLIFKSDFITPILAKLTESENIGAVSPLILNMDGTLCYGGCENIGKYLLRIHYLSGNINNALAEAQEVSLVHGAAVAIKRSVFNEIGGWPDIYFLYCEEIDLSIRLSKSNYLIWYEPRSVVYHVGSQSTGKESPLVYYYNTRNRLLLYKRNLKGSTRLISVFYQLVVINTQLLLKLLLEKKILLLKAVVEGSIDFLKGSFYKKE